MILAQVVTRRGTRPFRTNTSARTFTELTSKKTKIINILCLFSLLFLLLCPGNGSKVSSKIDSMICVRSFVEAICKTNSSTTSEHNNMSVSGIRVAGDGGGGGSGGGIDPSFALWPVVLLEDSISYAFTSAIRHLTSSWQRGGEASTTERTCCSTVTSAAAAAECHCSSHPVSSSASSSHLACHPDSITTVEPAKPAKHPFLSRSQSSTGTVMSGGASNNSSSSEWQTTGSSLMSSHSKLPEYSLEQVADHSTPSDCWIVIYDKIYDITHFLQEHPGGEFILLEFAGRDATLAFRGTRHGPESYELLKKYLIAILPESQRIYQKRKTSSNLLMASLQTEPNPSC